MAVKKGDETTTLGQHFVPIPTPHNNYSRALVICPANNSGFRYSPDDASVHLQHTHPGPISLIAINIQCVVYLPHPNPFCYRVSLSSFARRAVSGPRFTGCSGNALVSINAVALHRARLVLGWVTAFGQVNCLIT